MRYVYDSSGMNIGAYDPISFYYEQVCEVYETGEKPDSYFVRKSEKYGYLTSSIMAVKDSDGNIAALLFVDTHMDCGRRLSAVGCWCCSVYFTGFC